MSYPLPPTSRFFCVLGRDRIVEVEIPAGVYVHMGYAAKQTERYRGGATQIWLEDELINNSNYFDWNALAQQAELLPQF